MLDLTDPFNSLVMEDVTAQPINGIRRVYDDSPLTQAIGYSPQRPGLGGNGMDV
jgi:hypothetical protein